MRHARLGSTHATNSSKLPGAHDWPALRVCGAALLLLCGCQPVSTIPRFELKEEEWSYDGEPGALLTTDHFEIRTTIKDRELRDALPMFLESAYALYAGLLPPAAQSGRGGEGESGGGESGPRLQTFLFNTRGEWDRFTRKNFPERYPVYARIQNGGFAEGRACVVYYLQRAYTLSVIAHEGMHQYFGANFAVQVPAWLNEGLACYCESFEFQKDVPVFLPRRNTFRLNPLRQTLTGKATIPLRELLATHAGEVINEGRGGLTQAYYSQAWALIVFLRHGQQGRYAAGFQRLLDDVRGGGMHMKAQAAKLASGNPSAVSTGEAVFRAYITEDLDQFESDYKAFMADLAGLR